MQAPVDAPKIRNAKKRCNRSRHKQRYWHPVGVRSGQEARKSIKKKKKRKRQKGEKELQQNEASTGPSGGECEHPRGPGPKIGGFKKGEKGTSFGPAEGVIRVREKVWSGGGSGPDRRWVTCSRH